MGIKIDTDYTGNADDYVRANITSGAEKLDDVSWLLTTPAIAIGVYDLGDHTRETGMLLVVRQDDGHLFGGTEPFARVWRLIGNAMLRPGRSQEDQTKAVVQMTKYEPATRSANSVYQEFGDLENPTIIGMTTENTPPPGVTITQRFGNVTGGTIIGYDGSKGTHE